MPSCRLTDANGVDHELTLDPGAHRRLWVTMYEARGAINPRPGGWHAPGGGDADRFPGGRGTYEEALGILRGMTTSL